MYAYGGEERAGDGHSATLRATVTCREPTLRLISSVRGAAAATALGQRETLQ